MFTTEEIFKHANRVLEKTQLVMPVRMLAVSVSSLSSVTSQMSLFEDNLSKKELSRALDRINDKFGEYTVARGQMFGTEDMARDRIGFRKIN
jgi:DNA polymerase-4